MYADRITDPMKRAIDETNCRRQIQDAHSQANNIEPKSIQQAVHDITDSLRVADNKASYWVARQAMSHDDMFRVVKDLDFQMKDAARNLEFEKAAALRDEMFELRKILATEEKTFSG